MIDNKNIDKCNALFSAVGCVCFSNNEFLLLKRGADKSYPEKWGIPTGKIEKGETPLQAIVREVFEETHIILSLDRLTLVDTFCVTNNEMSFKYTLYYTEFEVTPSVTINPLEHSEYTWIHYDVIDNVKFVPDAKETVLFAIKQRNARPFAQLNLFTKEPDVPSLKTKKLEDYLKEFSGLEKKFSIQKNWIVSFGSPGAGKTSTLKALSKLNANYHLISDNSKILKKDTRLKRYFKEAMQNKKHIYYFFFQMEILPEKFRQAFNCPDNSFVDETIFSTLAYSTALYRLQWLTKEQYETFLSNYQFYLNFLPIPIEILYFYCSTETLLRRIKGRNRKIELHFTEAYVDALNKAFEDVAHQLVIANYNVRYIDTDKMSASKITRLISSKLKGIWI